MGIISRALGHFVPRLQSGDYSSPYVFRTLEGLALENSMNDSGVPVTADTSRGLAAVFACTNVLAQDVAALPLDLHERSEDDSRKKAKDHPLWNLLHNRPNGWQTSLEFREQIMWSAVLWGSGFAEIIMGPGGYAAELRPIQPQFVQVKQFVHTKRLTYQVSEPGRETRYLNQEEVFHLRGASRDGIRGMMLFREQASSWGLALAAEKYGGRLFKRGASHSGILSHPGTLGPEAKTRLEGTMEDFSGVENAGKTLALEEGVKYFPISMRARDAEWINSRKFSILEVCRAFRMQPHKVQSLDNATFTNIEHQGIEYVQSTLGPWLVRWEQALHRDIIRDDNLYVEFNVDALLRGDMATRFQAYSTATGGKPWMLPSEVRKKENMEPNESLDMKGAGNDNDPE